MPQDEITLTTKQVTVNPNITPYSPDTVPTFYSNHVLVEVSNLDVKLTLCHLFNDGSEQIQAREVGCVYMSHGHAAKLHEVLDRVLNQATQVADNKTDG